MTRLRIAKATMLLKCVTYADILESTRLLSLITQKTSRADLIKQVEAVDKTLNEYQIMKRRVQESDATATSVLPTIKHVLSMIQQEGLSVSQQHQYQGVAVTHLQQSKAAVNSLVHPSVVAINQSLARSYGCLVDADKDESSKETKDADEVAHSIAKLLYTRFWMKDATEDKLSVQMETISNVFNSFKDIEPLRQTNKQLLQKQHVVLVQWATSYFDVAVIDPMDLWPKLW